MPTTNFNFYTVHLDYTHTLHCILNFTQINWTTRTLHCTLTFTQFNWTTRTHCTAF